MSEPEETSMRAVDRFREEYDRMPHYGAVGCLCGPQATPDRECPLHAANWVIERLEDDLRRQAGRIDEARLLAELWTRSSDAATRRLGADLRQFLA